MRIGYGTQLALDRYAEKLVSYKSDLTVKKLFCALNDESKTMVVHLILTKKFEPENYEIKGKSVYKNGTDVGYTRSCNRLKWYHDNTSDSFSIAPEAVRAIIAYWKIN